MQRFYNRFKQDCPQYSNYINTQNAIKIMTNRFKLSLFQSVEEIQRNRLHIVQAELKQHWESLTLVQMEEILSITEYKLIEHVWQYFSYYLTNKGNSSRKDAYCIKKKVSKIKQTGPSNTKTDKSLIHRENQSYSDIYLKQNESSKEQSAQNILAYCYDCKIFKNSQLFSREDNQMLSSFLLTFWNVQKTEITEVYQFLNPGIHPEHRNILKIKSSCLLKFYSIFKDLSLQSLNGDTVVVPYEYYYRFIFNWTHLCQSWQIEPMIRHLFRGLMLLLHNQIALSFVSFMTQQQKNRRRYQLPVAIYLKPKLKQSSTMVDEEETLGDVQWSSLKVPGFKLKYKVKQDQKKYECFRVQDQETFSSYIEKQMGQLSQEDQNIIMAWYKVRLSWGQDTF